MASVPVSVVTVVPRPTAVIAETTSWEEFPRLWPQLLDEVYALVRGSPSPPGEGGSPRWQNIMLYKDRTPTVEIGVLAPEPFSPKGRVVASHLPDYAQLGSTHHAVREYLKAHGLEHAGPLWEIYGHWREDPAELETEIYWLLR